VFLTKREREYHLPVKIMQPSIAGARREGKPVSKPVERQRQEQKKATENNHLAKGVCCAILLSPRCFLNGVFAL
jgi:hypothetical protein